jgi:excisionase family DNA binding protein
MIVPRSNATPQPSFEELPDVLTPEDLWRYLPVGRNSVYDLLKSGRIQNTRVGQKIIITKSALRSFLNGGELK